MKMPDTLPLVAIVEDDESVLRATQRLLRSEGFSTLPYRSGEDFLGAVETHRPELLVLDLHLPGVDGFGVLKELKKRSLNISVVVVTADDRPASRDQVLRAGALECLSKPFSRSSLLRSLGRPFEG